MRKLSKYLMGLVVLAAGAFAAASIASGGPLQHDTTNASTTTTPSARKVTICHLTRSTKHPAVTITVSQNAVAAHLRHGDHLGKCTGSEKPRPKKKESSSAGTSGAGAGNSGSQNGHSNNGKGNGKGKGK